jgi:uncharacterized membrane protein
MLIFKNSYLDGPVWVMIEWYHPNCPDGGDWMKSGWWGMRSGESAVVHAGSVSAVNRFWYFFAHDGLGGYWAGPFEETVSPGSFRSCSSTSSTSDRIIGMRELDVGNNADYTVNIIG